MKTNQLKESLHKKLVITPTAEMQQKFKNESKGLFKCPRCRQKAMLLAFTTSLMLAFIFFRSPTNYQEIDTSVFITAQLELAQHLDQDLLSAPFTSLEMDEYLDDNNIL